MIRTVRRAITLSVALATAGLALAAPAQGAAQTASAGLHADSASTPTGQNLDRGAPLGGGLESKISGILLHNPGSHRISPDSVQVGDGVVISVGVQPNALQGCATFWICLNQNKDFGGELLRFEACRDENLGNYHMSNGTRWNDQVSSIRNAQSSGVQSRFYNYDGSGDPNNSSNWRFVLALNAGHYLRNLASDTSADGGNANDKIDIVHVC
jgi:hypothetical protein